MIFPKELRIDRVIRQASHKPASYATLEGTYAGQPVIVKRGGSQLRYEEAVLRAASFVGIPKVIDYLENDENDYLLMERLVGIPLSQYIDLDNMWHSKIVDTKDVIRITNVLALCFSALHEANYLYRDLSFGHVLVSDARIGLVDYEWCIHADKSGWGK